jgi:hypothetical protein
MIWVIFETYKGGDDNFWLSRIVLLAECVEFVIHSAMAWMEEGKSSGLGSPFTL